MNTKDKHIRSLTEGYLAGVLSNEEVQELFALIETDSLYSEDLKYGEIPVLRTADISFPNRNNLHKSYSDLENEQFELLCIADIEGDLSTDQSEEIKMILESDINSRKVYNGFRNLRLVPETITYKNKNALRRKTAAGKIIHLAIISMSAAASVGILVTAITFLNRSVEKPVQVSDAKTGINIPALITNETDKAGPEEIHVSADFIVNRETAPSIITAKEEKIEIITESGPAREAVSAPAATVHYAALLPSGQPSGSLAEINLTEPAPANYELSLRENITLRFKEKVLGIENPSNSPVKGYEIANAGLNGINKLLGWEMNLSAKTGEEGEVMGLSFNSGLIKIQTPVKKGLPDE